MSLMVLIPPPIRIHFGKDLLSLKSNIMRTLLIILCCFTILSCKSREDLTLKQQNYLGDKLRFDGYYYTQNSVNDIDCFFFYRNGIIHTSTYGNSIEEIDVYYQNNTQSIYNISYRWGVYNVINDESIKFEKWISSDGGPNPTVLFNGTIINDSTLIIENPASSFGTSTYQFHKTPYKPDSSRVDFFD